MTLYYFYKICSLDNEYIYIGSTTNFKNRMITHKSNCYNKKSVKYNFKLYSTIRRNGGFNNFCFNIIKSIETDDKKNVLKQEQELMILYNSNLNTIKSFMSDDDRKQYLKQYRIENKEHFQQYKIDNKEKIQQQKKEKHACICGGNYTNTNKSRHYKSKKHNQYEHQKQDNIINNTTHNITNNYNITNLTIQK